MGSVGLGGEYRRCEALLTSGCTMKKARFRGPSGRAAVGSHSQQAAGAQAFLHEGLALIALAGLGLRVGVARLHLALLGFLLGRQAGLHEGLALVALLVAGVGVARAHLALLRAHRSAGAIGHHRRFLVAGGEGRGRQGGERQGQNGHQVFHRVSFATGGGVGVIAGVD